MDKDTFIAAHQATADNVGKQLGVPASALLAQWGLETGWGKSVIPGTNNLGNIKDFSGKGVQATDNLTKSVDKYRAYATVEDFANDYASLIKRKYPAALNQTTATGFATALKAGGYAEDKDYVQKIATLAGEGPVPAGAGRGNVAPPMASEVLRMPQRSFKDEYEKLTRGILNAQVVKPTSAFEEQMSRDRMNENARLSADTTPNALEMVGAAMASNTGNSILRAIMRPRFEEEAGFQPDMSMLPANADRPLLDDFFAAKSSGEAKYAIDKFNEEQMRTQTVMSRGTSTGIALSFGGEILDPINWVVPFAAAKGLARFGMGSDTLMAAGKVGEGYKAAVVENLVSGTALEATKQSLEGEFKPVDLGISILADTFIGLGSGFLSARNAAATTTAKAASTALAREADLAKRAEQRLGSSATPEEVRKEMDIIRKEDANALISGTIADVPNGSKLIVDNSVDVRESVIEGQPTVTTTATTTVTKIEFPKSTIAAPDTPEFKAYFDGSKVVDETGAPKIMYHGTSANEDGGAFSAFRTDEANYGLFGRGAYFTDNPTTAASYVKKGGGDTKHVYATYLSIKNPIYMDGPANAAAWEQAMPGISANVTGDTNEAFFRAAEKMLGVSERKGGGMEITNVLKAMGHDGITHIGGGRVNANGRRHQVYIAFEQGQIKSAIGNSGAYDPTNPRLDMQLSEATKFADPGYAGRSGDANVTPSRYDELRRIMDDLPDTLSRKEREAAIDAIDTTPGTHIDPKFAKDPKMLKRLEALEALRKQMLPDVSIHLTYGTKYLDDEAANGVHGLVKEGVSVIAVHPNAHVSTMVHEFGHALMAHRLAKLPADQQEAMYKAWQDWQATYMTDGAAQKSAMGRSPIGPALLPTRDGSQSWLSQAVRGNVTGFFADLWDKAFPNSKAQADKYARYFGNFDEFSADQFTKFVEAEVAGLGQGKLTVPQLVLKGFAILMDMAAELFGIAKKANLVRATTPFENFFNDLIAGNAKQNLSAFNIDPPSGLQQMAVPAKPAGVVNELMQDPDYVRFGLTALPVGTAAERKEAQAILALYKKADAWEQANPMDDAWKARMKNLADNEVFNVASTGLKMLSSPSPLVRMLANELLEDASGVAGKRRATASIKKYMTERLMLGNALNDVQGAYSYWKKGKPGGFMDDLVGGKNWDAFNKEIASEIEARGRTGGPVSQDPNIKAAADSLEAAYQRIANEQRRVNTLGSEGLPESSVGYMPHRMSPKALIQLSNAKQQVVHSVLVDQFVSKGWDMSFADQLATKYLALARKRAAGDYGTAMSRSSAASHVEEALRGMDLPEDTIAKHMEKFNKGGASYTKGRLELDLNQIHMVDGEEFKLLDIYETNQLELLRAQAGRASGEVALTQFGVRGKPSADMIRRAMQYGEDGKRADLTRDFESYDQMMSEFYNEPYGTKTGRWMERAMNANAVVRLGGIAFNQLAETINGVAHVGVLRSLESIGDLRRLRKEILTLAKGGTVDNSIIGSIEHAGGAEFGTDAYKIVMPFDSPDHAFPTYGQDTLTAADRLLRGAGHVQSMLSGWRAVHSAQQRGMAEQIVHKMMRYIREGKDDIALEQFGIHADIRTALRNELSQIATFNGDRLVQFDVTKISDPEIREQVIQAVWRGTSQIIQGTYIGERGKWAHDGVMKLMTQFRTFSITSMEKQWGRQRNSHGTAAAFGLLMGAMTFAAPIYMARTYLSSIGRPDQEAYLEEKLAPQMIARSTLNYVASAGMAGDFMDLTTAMLPESIGLKPTGGRAGVETAFVGNYIAPASSLVDDIWKYAQSPLEVDEALKLMPGSRMPFLLPLVNLSRD